jgi:hypothetical protein
MLTLDLTFSGVPAMHTARILAPSTLIDASSERFLPTLSSFNHFFQPFFFFSTFFFLTFYHWVLSFSSGQLLVFRIIDWSDSSISSTITTSTLHLILHHHLFLPFLTHTKPPSSLFLWPISDHISLHLPYAESSTCILCQTRIHYPRTKRCIGSLGTQGTFDVQQGVP